MVTSVGTPVRFGTRLTSLTVTVMPFWSDWAGLPSSVTLTVKVYVPGPWASLGVQLKAPVAGSIVAPAGAFSRLKVGVFGGRSASVKVAVNVSVVPSSMVAEAGTPPSIGTPFTSLTVRVTVVSSKREPSLTRTLKVYVPGPWDSDGVQVKTP